MHQPQPPHPAPSPLLSLEPVPSLLQRVRQELSAEFDPARPLRVSRAPGRLDVMGGIADYTGSVVCEATLDRAVAMVLQERADRQLQVFSFNLLDENQPFTLRISLDALAEQSAESLRKDFAEPGRRWAGYLVGCLFLLHEQQYINLKDPALKGLTLALLSTVPLGAGVSSSAAIEVATMINLADHFALRGKRLDPMRMADLCQQVENRVVGAPCGIMDQVTSLAGETSSLLCLLCQPHELQPSLRLPAGIRVMGINSHVKHSVGGGMYGKTRCAAFMGHRIILEQMRQKAAAVRKTLSDDPLNGYLANLPPDDYQKLFRPYLPTCLKGQDFIDRYSRTLDTATCVDPNVEYHVQQATDHHVLEAHRVRQFIDCLQEASRYPRGSSEQRRALVDAGQLMYASHQSYTHNALLGAEECDLLVELVRQHEPDGFYGAKITGGGSGGTVAILAEQSPQVDAALAGIMAEYQQRTGQAPEAFTGSSPGAWAAGTALLKLGQ